MPYTFINPKQKLEIISKGNIEEIKSLFEEGSTEIDEILFMCAEYSNKITVECLTSMGANPNYVSPHGETTLMRAACNKDIEVLKFFIGTSKEFIDSRTIKGKDSALLFATHKGHIDNAKLLIENGATKNFKNKDGMNILHIAASKKQSEILSWILTNKLINVNEQDNYGHTALHFSALSGCLKCIKKLILNYKANPNVRTYNNNHYFHYAAQGGHESIIDWSLSNYKNHFNVIKNTNGHTPFTLAIFHGHEKVIKVFLQKDPSIVNYITSSRLSEYGIRKNTLEYALKENDNANGVFELLRSENLNIPDEWFYSINLNRNPDLTKQILLHPKLNLNINWKDYFDIIRCVFNPRYDTYNAKLNVLVMLALSDNALKYCKKIEEFKSICKKAEDYNEKGLSINTIIGILSNPGAYKYLLCGTYLDKKSNPFIPNISLHILTFLGYPEQENEEAESLKRYVAKKF